MKRKMRRSWRRKTAAIATAILTVSFGGVSHAMPQGEVIRSGDATIQRSDDNKSMEVNQSTKRVAIDWSSFDIANDERVNLKQPDASSVALNRVTGDAKSIIDGQLSSNGRVYVINPNGVLFGQNASVDVGSLVASTAKVSDATMIGFGKSSGGLTLSLDDANAQAAVINEGQIKAEGGLVALHAASVENSGTITSDGGKIALAAAKNISLAADTAGKLNFTVDGALAKASTLNSGVLKSDGGYVVMTAKQAGDVMSTVVNNTGTIEAKTLREDEKGEILLDGGDTGIVEIGGTLDVSGMEAGQSAGSIKAIGAETHVEDGATLHAIGAVDGGTIETSGNHLRVSDAADIDTSAGTGKTGTWLLDPTEIVIASKDSPEYTNAADINGDVSLSSGTSVISTESLVERLKKNNVTIEATDSTNHVADITLASALHVDTTQAGGSTLTLQAENDVIINAAINASSPLNVVLIGDSNGDDKGGVHINADIATGGGSFTTGANSATYFSAPSTTTSSSMDPIARTINTDGGAVNIMNEALLQLNGGALNISTNGGNVTFAKNIASMNSYVAYMDFDYVSYYTNGGTGEMTEQAKIWDALLQQIYGKTYTDANGNTVVFQIADGAGNQIAYANLTNEQRIALSNQLAQTWEIANMAATVDNPEDDPLGQNVNDSHLVTITDKYENTAAMAGAVKNDKDVLEYFTGGMDVTDPPTTGTAGRDIAWVTGPEAGTVFYKTTGEGTGEAVNGSYTNWVQNEPYYYKTGPAAGKLQGYYNEPNNGGGKVKQPYIAVGWTAQNGWDDVQNGYTTVHGFIRETELPNSALSINSGAGSVTIGTAGNADTGRIGSSEGTGIRNLDITTTGGDVTVNGSIYVHDNNTYTEPVIDTGKVTITSAGNITTGQITADNDVTITGTGTDKDVTVGGKIATTSGGVSITSGKDLLVSGVEAADRIKLISTGNDGKITLGDNAEGGGVLKTSSSANDAVVIDAQGENGSFVNNTTAESAIKTEGGSWKIYTASPELNTYGENLNSGTNAQWNADSTTYAADTDTDNTGKYIFQVQPTLTVKADDKTKVYGETFDPSQYSASTTGATFKGREGKTYDVKDAMFQNAFDEGDLNDRYSGTISYRSDGADAAKTRTGGTVKAADGNKAGYTIEATGNLTSRDGYDVKTADGVLQILKRTATITGNGEQTYGTSALTKWATTQEAENKTAQTGFVNGDKIIWTATEPAIKDGSTYAKNQAGRTTANAGTYADAVAVDYDAIAAANPDVIANYDLQAVGNIKVNEKVNEVEPNVPDDDVMVKQKPDLDAHEPSNTSGTASYTSNLGGRQGVPGVDRVAGLTDAHLPFFRVEAGKVTQYGTYDVTETPSEVRLQPTGKRLPEPNQPKTQYREYTKTLTTADGSGQFLMTYDGSTFRIEPTDGAALALVHAGDAKHNVDLSAKALHVGFSEMGLVLESLDAVYICLDGHSQTGSDELA